MRGGEEEGGRRRRRRRKEEKKKKERERRKKEKEGRRKKKECLSTGDLHLLGPCKDMIGRNTWRMNKKSTSVVLFAKILGSFTSLLCWCSLKINFVH